MAKKEAKKKTAQKNAVVYKGQKYTLLEEANGKCKLTDGTIHFWVKEKDVERD